MENIAKRYVLGRKHINALDGVSVRVGRGEFVTVVGESGSGKTTLMNIAGCLDSPTGGGYTLDGVPVGGLSTSRLCALRADKIGFIFQEFNLIPGLSALENVELPLIFRRIPKRRRLIMAAGALERVGLSDRMRHRPCELSGGQRQRVAIARAIVGKPPLLLADEPTGNLDAASGESVLKIIGELHLEGHTVMLITHDMSVASRADRIIRLRAGKIEA